MSINTVTLSGNLTRDAELRQTASGSAVLGFSLAVNTPRKNKETGEYEEYVNYIDCTLFGPRAEAVAKYLTKGTKVFLSGRLHWSSWERDGKKRSKLEVIVNDVEFGGKNTAKKDAEAVPTAEAAEYDEDIPF